MVAIVKKYGLHDGLIEERMCRGMGVERLEICGERYKAVHADCVEETARMEENSVDLIVTSIPFSNHYEYTPSYNDFGHNEDTAKFFEQMGYLSPNLLRVLKPGRVFACHVKDRVLFGNATGTGMPTMEPFHALCIEHYMKAGFQYFGMITVVTDVVRENNQTDVPPGMERTMQRRNENGRRMSGIHSAFPQAAHGHEPRLCGRACDQAQRGLYARAMAD